MLIELSLVQMNNHFKLHSVLMQLFALLSLGGPPALPGLPGLPGSCPGRGQEPGQAKTSEVVAVW